MSDPLSSAGYILVLFTPFCAKIEFQENFLLAKSVIGHAVPDKNIYANVSVNLNFPLLEAPKRSSVDLLFIQL